MDRARLRINLAQREVEIEGCESFVAAWAERLDELLGERAADEAPEAEAAPPPAARARTVLEPFGQYLQRLPKVASEVDRMLAAGYWVQCQAQDDSFATGDASRLLSEHGVRIGNPSQAVRQSLMAKRLFMVQKGRYRISLQGRQHLDRMIGSEFTP